MAPTAARVGKLSSRHVQVFNSNDYFKGLKMPEVAPAKVWPPVSWKHAHVSEWRTLATSSGRPWLQMRPLSVRFRSSTPSAVAFLEVAWRDADPKKRGGGRVFCNQSIVAWYQTLLAPVPADRCTCTQGIQHEFFDDFRSA